MIFGTETMAVWIVSLLVVVSVLWLALHGWRQGRTLVRWARRRGHRAGRPCGARTDAWLEPFRRDDDQMVREMGRVRETVAVSDDVYLLRCEERVDLTPWISGAGPRRTRIAVAFPAPEGWTTYSVFDEDGCEASEPPPGLRFSDPDVGRRIEESLPTPPHPLSVSLGGGRGIAYLLTPSGGVSADDLDYLVRLGRRLAATEDETSAAGSRDQTLADPSARETPAAASPGRADRSGEPRHRLPGAGGAEREHGGGGAERVHRAG